MMRANAACQCCVPMLCLMIFIILTPESAMEILTATAVDLGEPGWDPMYGYGRIDAAAAVALVTLMDLFKSEPLYSRRMRRV